MRKSTLVSDDVEIAVMQSLCKRFRTVYAKRLLSSHFARDVIESFDFASYTDPISFSQDYLLHNFLKKWKGWSWSTSVERERAAFDSWIGAERLCKKTNLRFSAYASDVGKAELESLLRIRDFIQSIIGSAPPSNLANQCRWSSGATFDLSKADSDVYRKGSCSLSITERAHSHFSRVIDKKWYGVLNETPFTFVKGNRMVMVPKTAKTDRPIAAEPTANAFMQQAVGRYFRRQLKAVGVDLDDQTINRDLAFSAVFDDLATIDLSSASDTLASSVVRILLPPEWFALLNDLRSPFTSYKGRVYRLEKFSSMGNAFTFELESLIFYAIAQEASNYTGVVSVYGDDIIVEQRHARSTMALLRYLGFIPSPDKSFVEGPFYESCGGQYFDGEDVTPVYQKEHVRDSLAELLRLHNRLYRWQCRNVALNIKDALLLVERRVERICKLLNRAVPRVPHGSQDDAGLLTRGLRTDRNGDYPCLVFARIPRVASIWHPSEIEGALCYKLRRPSFSQGPDGHPEIEVGEVRRFTKRIVWASSLS